MNSSDQVTMSAFPGNKVKDPAIGINPTDEASSIKVKTITPR